MALVELALVGIQVLLSLRLELLLLLPPLVCFSKREKVSSSGRRDSTRERASLGLDFSFARK